MAHSYPADLAEVVLRTWHDGSSLTGEYCEAVHDHDALPAPDVLATILSTCYQASLLREEERPVCFRLIVANAASFPAPGGPPHGVHRLLFDKPRPLSHHELRRLAPAVDFHRALIGAQIEPRDGLMLWGMITTGPRWVQAMYGGRQRFCGERQYKSERPIVGTMSTRRSEKPARKRYQPRGSQTDKASADIATRGVRARPHRRDHRVRSGREGSIDSEGGLGTTRALIMHRGESVPVPM